LSHAFIVNGRADEIGDLLHQIVRILDRHAIAGPVDELDVVLPVAEREGALTREAEPLGKELEAGGLLHVRRGELEEVRQ
jgi:hypothetical protein